MVGIEKCFVTFFSALATILWVSYVSADPTMCPICNATMTKQGQFLKCPACDLTINNAVDCQHQGACPCALKINHFNSDHKIAIHRFGELVFNSLSIENLSSDDSETEPLLSSLIAKLWIFPDIPNKKIKEWKTKVREFEIRYYSSCSFRTTNSIQQVISEAGTLQEVHISLGELSQIQQEDEIIYYLIIVQYLGVSEFYGLMVEPNGAISIISTEESSYYILSATELYQVDFLSEHMRVIIFRKK